MELVSVHDRMPLRARLRAELFRLRGGLEALERYAKTPGWTVGVMLANVVLFTFHALRASSAQRFWTRG